MPGSRRDQHPTGLHLRDQNRGHHRRKRRRTRGPTNTRGVRSGAISRRGRRHPAPTSERAFDPKTARQPQRNAKSLGSGEILGIQPLFPASLIRAHVLRHPKGGRSTQSRFIRIDQRKHCFILMNETVASDLRRQVATVLPHPASEQSKESGLDRVSKRECGHN